MKCLDSEEPDCVDRWFLFVCHCVNGKRSDDGQNLRVSRSSSSRVGGGEEPPAVRSTPDAAAGAELLPPAPGGIRQRLQRRRPDASVELLHRPQTREMMSLPL